VKILGISPLDKDASASLVEDGRVLFAAGEERFNRVKQTSGFPGMAIEAALEATGTDPSEIAVVAYPFLEWQKECELIAAAFEADERWSAGFDPDNLELLLQEALARTPGAPRRVHGLSDPEQTMQKGALKELAYRIAGSNDGALARAGARSRAGLGRARAERPQALVRGAAGRPRAPGPLGQAAAGRAPPLARRQCLAGERLRARAGRDPRRLRLGPRRLGQPGRGRQAAAPAQPALPALARDALRGRHEFARLPARPPRREDRRSGGLRRPAGALPALLSRIEFAEQGDYRLYQNLNVHFSRHLAARFPMIDVAAAYQHVLEVVATRLVAWWVRETRCADVVLSGGVAANVKMNQRIHELEEVERTFVYPNMGDGGCGTGLALLWSAQDKRLPTYSDVYYGPEYTPAQIQEELERAGLRYERPADLVREVAARVHAGEVIGRFAGRMEYGPRALGNRTILYHAREPEVNQWLNKRLGRTEFMPFAPVTLWEAREKCYLGLEGAEHAAEFMTITFDCTEFMRTNCPAAVHVDGTARPQLVRRETNPEYHAILSEYEKLSGIPA
jgi:carbamoyltransferase